MGVLVLVVVVVVVTGVKQSQLLVPRQKSGLWTWDWSLTKVKKRRGHWGGCVELPKPFLLAGLSLSMVKMGKNLF